jgi:uncharacterized repeat protein (TIGR02543 family)
LLLTLASLTTAGAQETYLVYNTETQLHEPHPVPEGCIELTECPASLGIDGQETWYVVRQILENTTDRVVIHGTVNLIFIANGDHDSRLIINQGIRLTEGNTLVVYSKSQRWSGLYVGVKEVGTSYYPRPYERTITDRNAGIGCDDGHQKFGTLIVHSGEINACGGPYACGIGSSGKLYGNEGGKIVVYGGYVLAAAGDGGFAIGSTEAGHPNAQPCVKTIADHETVFVDNSWNRYLDHYSFTRVPCSERIKCMQEYRICVISTCGYIPDQHKYENNCCKWCGIHEYYYVTYHEKFADGGTLPEVGQYHNADWADPVTSANPGNLSRKGFLLTGWTTEPDGGGRYYALGSRFALGTDLSLYAYWQRRINVTGDAEKGNIVCPASADPGTDVTVQVTPRQGYTIEHVTLTDGVGTSELVPTNGQFTFTMPDEEVTIQVTYTALHVDTEGNTLLYTVADWKSFALSVADGETFEGQTVRLAQDIIVSTMVGTSDRKFKGTFDGGGHTLTFNLTTAEAYAAPFRYTEDATIRNLTVNGMIQTSQKFAAGIIAHNEGVSTLEHCTSNIIINSTVNGDGSHGGMVAYNAPFCTMDITDCAFYGQLLGSSTTHCGGMVGYNDYGPVLIIRSEADWNAFAEKVRQGTNYAGQTILLAADIKVSKPVGNHIAEFAFNGIFEGNGHSVSINSNNSATGLFDNVNNATIRNLKVLGSIRHCADKLGSVIGTASGEVAIQNCWSSVNVTHDASGSDSYVGALIGRVSRSAIVHIYDCLFTGSIKYNDRQKYKSDGMVGESRGSSYFWNCFFKPYNIRIRLCDNSSYNFARGGDNVTNCFYNDVAREPDWRLQGRYAFKMTEQEICDALGEGWEMKDNIACPKMKKLPENEKAGLITFTNCVFAPQQVTMSTTGSSTLCRNPQNSNGSGRSTFTGCTYTQAFGTAQGTKIGQETLTHNISVDKAIEHGKVEVSATTAQTGETVTLAITPDEGYAISAVTYNDGVEHTISCKDGGYSFVMPNADVTVSATFSTVTIDKEIQHGKVEIVSMCKRTSEPVTLRVTPEEGYIVGRVTYNDGAEHTAVWTEGAYVFTMPKEDVVVSAKFSTITIDPDIQHGKVEIANMCKRAGEEVVLTITPERGYAGVVTYNDGIEHIVPLKDGVYSFAMPTTDVVVSAKFSIDEYHITYDIDRGHFEGEAPTCYTMESETFTLPQPVRKYSHFKGWTGTGLKAPTKEVTIAKGSIGDRTYTATWEDIYSGLTINPNKNEDEDGYLYVNMPATGKKEVILKERTPLTFKLYDDGGENFVYTNNAEGCLTLTVPKNFQIQLSGYYSMHRYYDTFQIYEGKDVSGNPVEDAKNHINDTNKYNELSNRTFATETLTFYLSSDGSDRDKGVDLTVKIIPPVTLASNADNETVIHETAATSETASVILNGWTLHHDGRWNTLCLPFDVDDIASTPLGCAEIRTLESVTEEDGTLAITFGKANRIEAGKPYIVKSDIDLYIRTDEDWKKLADRVNRGETFEGKYVLLCGDVNVTTMVGTRSCPFKGAFDGGGHTLKVNISDSSNDGQAPFFYICDAVIRNVKATGSVTGTNHCSGLVGLASGKTNLITNCEVAVKVTNRHNNDWRSSGGILGHGHSATNTVRNCVFSGSITGTTRTGMIYGWGDVGGTHIVENCLANGTFNNGEVLDLLDAAGGKITVKNSYKTTKSGSRGTYTTTTGSDLQKLLGDGWELSDGKVVPVLETSKISLPDVVTPCFTNVKVKEGLTPVSVEGVNFVGCTSPASIADTKAGQMVLLFDDADGEEKLSSFHAYLTLPEGVKKVTVDYGDGASDAVITNHRLVEVVTLYDIVENHVDEHIGQTRNVLLASRTIDNEWNTLALPFDVTDVQLDETFGAGWALYEFSGSSMENGVLGLSFRKAENIEAGVPYFFRVSDDVKAVQEPVFHGVQMEVADEKPSTTAFVDFLPTLNITQIEGESIKEVLILGGGNTLYNPAVLPAWMRSYRGYFRVHDVNMDVAQFRMSFDIDDEVSGIVTVGQDSRQDCIYTLDGQQLKSQPTQRGFYITGNKKVMVK